MDLIRQKIRRIHLCYIYYVLVKFYCPKNNLSQFIHPGYMKIFRLKMSRKWLEYRVNQFILKFLKNGIGENINWIVSVSEFGYHIIWNWNYKHKIHLQSKVLRKNRISTIHSYFPMICCNKDIHTVHSHSISKRLSFLLFMHGLLRKILCHD